MKNGFYYVYILRTVTQLPHFYAGFTEDLDARTVSLSPLFLCFSVPTVPLFLCPHCFLTVPLFSTTVVELLRQTYPDSVKPHSVERRIIRVSYDSARSLYVDEV